ncbi:MAG: ABC transporter permease [Synergistales bacterium]|nr:ABC transporter permease [Synergistales bacterium]
MRMFKSRAWFPVLMGSFLVAYVVWPLLNMFLRADWGIVASSAREPEVLGALWRSIWTAAASTGIIALFGTPLAYLLARREFRGKSVLEAVIDLPIMVPHTVAGIAVLLVISPKAPLGALIKSLGLQPINSATGIVLACIFVSIPFYVDSARDAFAGVSPHLEKVSRTLGGSMPYTFFHITLPLARRGIFSGLIMSWARAVSEFGAIVIIAYHPMVAPVLIYDRFQTFGLKYSSPIAVQLICISLFMFVTLRLLAGRIRIGRGESS